MAKAGVSHEFKHFLNELRELRFKDSLRRHTGAMATASQEVLSEFIRAHDLK